MIMHKRYKAKHYKEKSKNASISKMIVTVILLTFVALNSMSDILCYFISKTVSVNVFSIAECYIVHFDANEGIGTMSDQEIFCGAHTNLTLNKFTKSGYVFLGWNTSADGNGTSYENGENVVDIALANSSITLYAQWGEETYEAEIDGVKYKTLVAAVNSVGTNTGQKTIKLLKNVELTSVLTIPKNKNIVLDLRSFTLKNSDNSNINIIANNGTLEIISGTIQSSAANGAINNNDTGILTISGGRIITTGTRQAIYNSGGIVEITGDAYISSSSTERATVNNNKPTNGPAGTITISGGTIVSLNSTTKGAVENSTTGILNITGGEIISNNCMGVDNQGTLVIGENDRSVDATTPVIQGATYGVTSINNLTLEFYDGIIKGKQNAFNNQNYITDYEDGYDIINSTEVISGYTYQTAYLKTEKARVDFDANGGITQENIRLVDKYQTIGTLPTATRERYSFDGWYTAETGGTQVDATQIITENVTYYAHWTQTEAFVIFDAAGGSATEETRLVNCGTEIGTLPTATKQYKVFDGWYTEPTGGEIITSTTVISEDKTYYAHWSVQYITVTFDPNEGTVSEPTRNVEAGTQIGNLPIPTRADYGFSGWYTDPSAGTKINQNEVITETTTYYAHWISSYVAEIEPVKYETLQAAIDAAPNDNTETTIKLLTDTEEAIIVDTNKNIVLDLQNYRLYNNGSKKVENEFVAIINKGTLKIIRGTVTADTNSATINNEAGAHLIVTGGNIIQTGTGGKKNKQAIYNNGGTVEISGTTYISAKNSGSYNNNERGAIQNLNNENSTGVLIIRGGTIESLTGCAIVNQSSAILTLGTKDGIIGATTPEIRGNTYAVKSKGIFNFYDGIVKGKNGSIQGNSGPISDTEVNATRVDTTETIGTVTYNVTYYE